MTNNATIETAKGLTFGTELEYTNITREKAAKAIHSVVGGTVRYYGGEAATTPPNFPAPRTRILPRVKSITDLKIIAAAVIFRAE